MEENKATIRITQFEEITAVVENRICGWIEKALALAGYKEVHAVVESSLAMGAPFTDITANFTK